MATSCSGRTRVLAKRCSHSSHRACRVWLYVCLCHCTPTSLEAWVAHEDESVKQFVLRGQLGAKLDICAGYSRWTPYTLEFRESILGTICETTNGSLCVVRRLPKTGK